MQHSNHVAGLSPALSPSGGVGCAQLLQSYLAESYATHNDDRTTTTIAIPTYIGSTIVHVYSVRVISDVPLGRRLWPIQTKPVSQEMPPARLGPIRAPQ